MEAATALRSPQFLYRAPGLGSRSCVLATHRTYLSFDFGGCRPVSLSKKGARRFCAHRSTAVRASARSSSESATPIAPLPLESPVGQFLSHIILRHPHLLRLAVDQQLQQLWIAHEAEQKEEMPAPWGNDTVLYRMIIEVKAKERKRAIEDILYALIVQNFVEVGAPLVADISRLVDPSGRTDEWPSQDYKLEEVHSPEAYEMVETHLDLILGQQLSDSESGAPITKLKVGQFYAASIMYGYFLKRMDQSFALEKCVGTLPWRSDDEESAIKQMMPDQSKTYILSGISHPEVSSWSSPSFDESGFGNRNKSYGLRSYVMLFDSDTLQMFATIRSKEALSIIEKHTEALFGRPEFLNTPGGTKYYSKDEHIRISFGGLRRLILEAMTFGSFLWDNEWYVDSRYRFTTS